MRVQLILVGRIGQSVSILLQLALLRKLPLYGLLVRRILEQASVVYLSNVLLPQHTVRWPNDQIRGRPLKDKGRPSEKVHENALAGPHKVHVADVQAALAITVIVCKDLLEVLGPETTFVVIGTGIAPVLVLVNSCHMNA